VGRKPHRNFISKLNNKKIKVMENLERFYEWMLKMNNIHLADNEKMARAYEMIVENNAQIAKMSSPAELVLDQQAFAMPNFVRV